MMDKEHCSSAMGLLGDDIGISMPFSCTQICGARTVNLTTRFARSYTGVKKRHEPVNNPTHSCSSRVRVGP